VIMRVVASNTPPPRKQTVMKETWRGLCQQSS
jgi:hypothetical protein